VPEGGGRFGVTFKEREQPTTYGGKKNEYLPIITNAKQPNDWKEVEVGENTNTKEKK